MAQAATADDISEGSERFGMVDGLTAPMRFLINIGRGACKILSDTINKSESYKNYYMNVSHPTVSDYVKNLVNQVGRGGAFALMHGVDIANRVSQTETYGQIKERISKGYANVRDGVLNYVGGYYDKTMQRARDDIRNNNGQVRTSTKFMALANTVMQTIRTAYENGDRAIFGAKDYVTDKLGTFADNVSKTDEFKELSNKVVSAYDKMRSERDKMDGSENNKDDEKGGMEQDVEL